MIFMVFLLGIYGDFTHLEANEIVKMDTQAALNLLNERGKTPYDFGMDLLIKHDMAKEAEKWFDRLIVHSRSDNDTFVYGKAWVKYAGEDADGALLLASHLLSTSQSEIIQARSGFLIGIIHQQWGDYARSETHLVAAQKIYTSLGKQGGVNKCRQQIIQCLIAKRDFQGAEALLSKVHENEFYGPTKELFQAQTFLLESLLHYRRQEIGKAIAACDQALGLLRNGPYQFATAWAKMRKGFYLALSGEVDASLSLATEVHEYARQTDNKKLESYNGIVISLIWKSRNFYFQQQLSRVRRYAEEKNDPHLLQLVDVVENFDPGAPLPLSVPP